MSPYIFKLQLNYDGKSLQVSFISSLFNRLTRS